LAAACFRSIVLLTFFLPLVAVSVMAKVRAAPLFLVMVSVLLALPLLHDTDFGRPLSVGFAVSLQVFAWWTVAVSVTVPLAAAMEEWLSFSAVMLGLVALAASVLAVAVAADPAMSPVVATVIARIAVRGLGDRRALFMTETYGGQSGSVRGFADPVSGCAAAVVRGRSPVGS
jgi:hypothetical protein